MERLLLLEKESAGNFHELRQVFASIITYFFWLLTLHVL